MNRESIVAAGFHWSENQRHKHELFKIESEPVAPIPNPESLNLLERFNQMRSRLEPLLKPMNLYNRDWYLTPEVPLTGEVEGEKVVVHLSIQVQKGKLTDYYHIAPQIRAGSENAISGGMYVSRGGASAQYDRTEGEDESLDSVEETVNVYFETVASLSPKELMELEFPPEFVPEDIQLSLEGIPELEAPK